MILWWWITFAYIVLLAPNPYNENTTVARYEIMDGAPIRGETIPLRLFLNGIDDLSPTFRDVNKKFSIRYYLNLVLIDEENRRYFKQQVKCIMEFAILVVVYVDMISDC